MILIHYKKLIMEMSTKLNAIHNNVSQGIKCMFTFSDYYINQLK